MAPDLVGLVGMSFILSAFLMNQMHKWRDGCMSYELVNATGSALLIYYALLIASWPFLLLNIVWLTASIRGSLLDLKKTQKGKARIVQKSK